MKNKIIRILLWIKYIENTNVKVMNPSKILGLIVNIIFEYCFKNDYIYIYIWFFKIYITDIVSFLVKDIF